MAWNSQNIGKQTSDAEVASQKIIDSLSNLIFFSESKLIFKQLIKFESLISFLQFVI